MPHPRARAGPAPRREGVEAAQGHAPGLLSPGRLPGLPRAPSRRRADRLGVPLAERGLGALGRDAEPARTRPGGPRPRRADQEPGAVHARVGGLAGQPPRGPPRRDLDRGGPRDEPRRRARRGGDQPRRRGHLRHPLEPRLRGRAQGDALRKGPALRRLLVARPLDDDGPEGARDPARGPAPERGLGPHARAHLHRRVPRARDGRDPLPPGRGHGDLCGRRPGPDDPLAGALDQRVRGGLPGGRPGHGLPPGARGRGHGGAEARRRERPAAPRRGAGCRTGEALPLLPRAARGPGGRALRHDRLHRGHPGRGPGAHRRDLPPASARALRGRGHEPRAGRRALHRRRLRRARRARALVARGVPRPRGGRRRPVRRRDRRRDGGLHTRCRRPEPGATLGGEQHRRRLRGGHDEADRQEDRAAPKEEEEETRGVR